MNPWRPFPLIRLIIPILSGAAAGLLTERDIHIPPAIIAGILILLVIVVFNKSFAPSYKRLWIPGILIFLLLFLLTYENSIDKKDGFDRNYFIKYASGNSLYIADVTEQPVQKLKTTKTVLNVVAVLCKGRWMQSKGKALVYIQKNSASEQLFFGDRILFQAEFTEPKGAAFPNTFDQRKFLSFRDIHYISYIRSWCWKTLANERIAGFQRKAFIFRNKLLQILRDNHVTGREFAVTAALLLGYVDEIDKGLMRDYSATGAMHILSVSGMHVGIIFLVLDKLLGFTRRIKRGLIIRTTLIILMIWFYAMLTGLSPAVLRASVMISLVVFGKAMKRQPEILNILAASFIILVIDKPSLLVDVGFQLSYVAVGGIVLLYKPVYDLYITDNHLLNKTWSIIAVSVAAQIITFPLSFYYFHQFPNYFMITNVVVVPLSTLVIYTGILLLFLGSVPFVSTWLAKFLTGQVWLLNHSLHFFEELPFSVSSGIYINILQTICIYLVVLMLCLFAFRKYRIFLFLGLIFSILLGGSFITGRICQSTRGKIIFYSSKNMGATDFFSGGTSILLYDPKVKNDDYFEENHLATCSAMGIDHYVRMLQNPMKKNPGSFSFKGVFYKNGDFIRFYNKRIGFLRKKLPKRSGYRLRLDYLVITGNPGITLEKAREFFIAGEIIIDPSNAKWRTERWKTEALKLGIKIRLISESGAIMVDVK